MPSPSANPTPITPPRVPFIDPRTGLIDRAWYMFLLSLFNIASRFDEAFLGPPVQDQSGNFANLFDQAQLASMMARYDDCCRMLEQRLDTLPSDQSSELKSQLDTIAQALGTLAQFDIGALLELAKKNIDVDRFDIQPQYQLGTMAPLQQDNLPWVVFDTTAENVPVVTGAVAWDGGTTLGVQATPNVLIRVGESEYVYAKASAAITKGQLCYHTGAVGASGVITVAPTPIGLTDPNQLVGVAAETLALNDFGLIEVSGVLRGFDTTGSSVGETWADGDPLYYNPAYVGSMTKVKPSAPNQKSYIGEVINAASAGSGSMHIRIVPGSVLGGTDSNVQFNTLVNKDLIQYDSALQYWKNVTPASVLASAWGPPVTKTADFTVAANETWIINNKSGSSCTATLPVASSYSGRVLFFQNYQNQTLVSASSNVVPRAGGAAGTSILDNVAGDTATLVSDGTNWIVMQYGRNNTLLLE